MTHTPGPWWIESGVIHAKDPNRWTEANQSCVHIGTINEDLDNAEANGLLVVAAEELLKACRAIISANEAAHVGTMLFMVGAAAQKARSAIAKATGTES